MNLIKLIRNLLTSKVKIDVKKLPSQGFFYNDDFEIYIKKADINDISEYESDYNKENLSSVLRKLKKIVEKTQVAKQNDGKTEAQILNTFYSLVLKFL